MVSKPKKYKQIERFLTVLLLADTALFVGYMIAAGNGVTWLKIVLTLSCLGISGLILWILYASNEIMRQRSLWITTGAVSIVVCLFFSLILNFPSPNKYKHPAEVNSNESTSITTERN